MICGAAEALADAGELERRRGSCPAPVLRGREPARSRRARPSARRSRISERADSDERERRRARAIAVAASNDTPNSFIARAFRRLRHEMVGRSRSAGSTPTATISRGCQRRACRARRGDAARRRARAAHASGADRRGRAGANITHRDEHEAEIEQPDLGDVAQHRPAGRSPGSRRATGPTKCADAADKGHRAARRRTAAAPT